MPQPQLDYKIYIIFSLFNGFMDATFINWLCDSLIGT